MAVAKDRLQTSLMNARSCGQLRRRKQADANVGLSSLAYIYTVDAAPLGTRYLLSVETNFGSKLALGLGRQTTNIGLLK